MTSNHEPNNSQNNDDTDDYVLNEDDDDGVDIEGNFNFLIIFLKAVIF